MSWQEVLSNEVLDIRDGTHDSPKYLDEGYPLITSKNLKQGIIDFSDVSLISEEDYNNINKRSRVNKGDILYSMIGSIGNYALVNKEPHYAIKNVALFKFIDKRLYNKYFLHLINSFVIERQIKKAMKGGTQKFVSLKILRNLKIPLPPLDQQKKIAAILDAADAYRQKTKALLKKYDELTQSLFLEMFGDPVTNPKGWEIKTIGDCFNVKGGKRLPKGSEYETTVTKHAYIRVKDFMANGLDTSDIKYISEEIHDKISRYIISSNDVYISIAGTIGLSGYVPESLSGANLTENAAKLIPKEAIEFRKEYLSFYLNSDYAQQNIKSKTMAVGVPKLALFRIQELPYINAPINVQDIFVRRVQAIESQKAQAQASLVQAEDLFNSLLQRAFKGELT